MKSTISKQIGIRRLASLFIILLSSVALGVLNSAYDSKDTKLSLKPYTPNKATGTIQIEWKGGGKGNAEKKESQKYAYVNFNAHEGYGRKSPKGQFCFWVTSVDQTLLRRINVQVTNVSVDSENKKAWFTGKVVSDTKGCNGDSHGGHSGNCSGGGCSGHDSGCGGHDDEEHDDESEPCTHNDEEDDNHDDGCTDHDDDTSSDGCEDGSDSGHNGISGKNCRMGQLIAVKVHDGGSPGNKNDGITWKWFKDSDPSVPVIENLDAWPHLCKKVVLTGNLVVHSRDIKKSKK